MLTLNTTGFLFTETAVEWNLFSADFGDGFEAAAIVGAPEGTRTWTLKIGALPGDGGGEISDDLEPSFMLLEDGGYLLMEDGGRFLLEWDSARAAYLFRFLRVSQADGNLPFWIELEDPADGLRKLFLSSFAENKLSYEIFCSKIFSVGINLRQRRLRDVESPLAVS